ncbi:unnamed protein product [Lota lota]
MLNSNNVNQKTFATAKEVWHLLPSNAYLLCLTVAIGAHEETLKKRAWKEWEKNTKAKRQGHCILLLLLQEQEEAREHVLPRYCK